MPATLLLQIPIRIFVYRTGLLRPTTWPARLRRLWRGESGGEPALEFITASFLLYFLLPQVWTILRDPKLTRPYIARLMYRPAKPRPVKAENDRLLKPVGERDVVLGDAVTSWPVPSSRGRICRGPPLRAIHAGSAAAASRRAGILRTGQPSLATATHKSI
jgi:hypothetical protein